MQGPACCCCCLDAVRDNACADPSTASLCPLSDVLFTELPAPTPENEAAWAASQPGLGEALAAQLLTLKAQLAGAAPQLATLVSPEEQQRLAAYKALTSDKLRPSRDAGGDRRGGRRGNRLTGAGGPWAAWQKFGMLCHCTGCLLSTFPLPTPLLLRADGFRKQAVVLTAGGQVAALHTGDGRVLWSLNFGRGEGLRKLALWRVPHDVKHDIEVGGERGGNPWG